MKKTITILLCVAFPIASAVAEPGTPKPKGPPTKEDIADALKKHQEGAKKLAIEQDDLSADAQDLNDEQTDPELKKLLLELEGIMADATDELEATKTGGRTIAIETEIIEKIFEAAKKKQQQQQKKGSKEGQKSMGSMLEMLKNMMEGGKDVGEGEGEKPGEGKGKKAGEGGGGGDGNGGSGGKTGAPDNTAENSERRVPKNSGSTGTTLPREFHKAMDAYNKGAADKSKKSK